MTVIPNYSYMLNEIETLQAQVASLTAERDRLLAQVAALEAENERLNSWLDRIHDVKAREGVEYCVELAKAALGGGQP